MANKNAIPPEQGKFEPGKSGNPNGRPKGVPNTATRLQRFLNATMRGKNPVTKEDEDFTVAELMDLKQIQKALNGDTAAWEKILDRMEGKAMQRNENINLDMAIADPDTITPDKIAELERILGNGKRDNETGTLPGKRKR